MTRFRAFVIVALVLGLGGPSLLAAGKGRGKAPAHKKAAPNPKRHVAHKVKPRTHKRIPHKATGTAKAPPKKSTPVAKNRRPRRPERVHHFVKHNPRTHEYAFDSDWWYKFVDYPTTVSGSVAAATDYSTLTPPPGTKVTPPVVKSGQGLPLSKEGTALAQVLDGMDVEHNWLPGKRVDWKTGKALVEQGPASNNGVFVAAVCARFKVPMPTPAPENFLPGHQYDWLMAEGKDKGWRAIGGMEAQLLANQGWIVIAAWKNPAPAGERTIPALTAIVRPDGKPATDLPTNGPRLVMAGAQNRKDVAAKDGFPAKAWADKEVVFLANRPR
jgi:hypothetical protein